MEEEVARLLRFIDEKYKSGEMSSSEYAISRLNCLDFLDKLGRARVNEEKGRTNPLHRLIGSVITSLGVGFLSVAMVGVISGLFTQAGMIETVLWFVGFGIPGMFTIYTGLKLLGEVGS
ncbi:MAG: hypothetical protein ACFFA1_07305 [Promethearchaeota archaeon]